LNADLTVQTSMMAGEEVHAAVDSRIRLSSEISKAPTPGVSLNQPDIEAATAIATVVSTDIADTATAQQERKEVAVLEPVCPAFGLHDQQVVVVVIVYTPSFQTSTATSLSSATEIEK
jgi:hypothetical protein